MKTDSVKHDGTVKAGRIGIVHLVLAMFALALLVQAGRVQLLQTQRWRERANRQQYARREVPAPRGAILDAGGRVLAESREVVRLEIAPREVIDVTKLRRALAKAGVSKEWVARATDRKRAWVVLPGRFVALDVAPVTALRGVHPTTLASRSYAISAGSRGIIGSVNANGDAVDGLELALDSILRGTAGQAMLVRDVRGRSFESPTAPGVAARAGHTVTLTIHHDLQEIAERALAQAVQAMNAEGGDIVILDPQSGQLLAMASQGAGGNVAASTAVTEPFEPGSTMKPFMAAGLLQRGKVTARDSVDTGNGVIEINGREIHDEHHIGRAPLSEVLRWSSNVGIVKFAQRLTPREEFETLRDFGFGTATGLTYPSESNGTLREPSKWSAQSAASLAIGYEVAATPLQLATAYAVFANGGELLEPALVKEIRTADGKVIYTQKRRVVRRVVSPDVATKIRTMLLNVVENGTALQADISNYLLAGKTGTPRRTVGGRYQSMQYNPNFVGLFPGDDPQYVIVVKITNPKGTFYGGTTAAPVTKAVLTAALAARDAALDRGKLATSMQPEKYAKGETSTIAAAQQAAARAARAESLGRPLEPSAERIATQDLATSQPLAEPTIEPITVSLPLAPTPRRAIAGPRAVPDVRGMSLRDAVRSLHTAGFRVQLARGADGNTSPGAGTVVPPGSLVRLQYDY